MSRKKINRSKKKGNPGSGKHNTLTDSCNKLINENPQNANAYFIRAQQKFLEGDLQGAVLDLDKVLAIFPKYLKALIYRGVIFIYLCEYDSAIKDLSEAILLDPKNSDVYLIRGDAYRALGKLPESIDDFDFVIKTSPKEALAYVGRGDTRLLLHDTEGAKSDYAMAIAINPSVKTICHGIGEGSVQESESLSDQQLVLLHDQQLGSINDQQLVLLNDQQFGLLNDQQLVLLNDQQFGLLNVQPGSLKNETVSQKTFFAASKITLIRSFRQLKRYYARLKVRINSSLNCVIFTLVLPISELLSDSVIFSLIEK